jgi:hypothetical protein
MAEHSRGVGARGLRGSALRWAGAYIAAGALLTFHPFAGELDRGSVLAIAGLMLATLAVTFGLVVVLAQHMAETYARVISVLLGGGAIWRSAVAGEAVAVIGTVAIALWRPDLTSGAAASVVLVASLLESWFAVTKLLRQFDPVNLIHALQKDAIDRMQPEEDRSTPAVRLSQAILNLLLQGASKGDVEVVAEGLAAWNAILARYLEGASLVWDDPYLYWLSPRCEELIERYARESVGLLLPEVVDGVAALGRTTGSYRNPLNAALDDGTRLFTNALTTAVVAAGGAVRSPAAVAAAQGVGSIGMACIEARKFTTLQGPVKALTVIGRVTAGPAVHVAGRATVELATLLIALARSDSVDVMRAADAESAIEGIREIVQTPSGGPDPAHFLTAPLAEANLPLICQSLARAAGDQPDNYRRGKWDRMARSAAELALGIMADAPADAILRMNALDTVGCVALGILALGRLDPYGDVLARISEELLQTTLRDDDGRVEHIVASVFLAIYVASEPPQPGELRTMILGMARVIRGAEDRGRPQLAPLARQLGATAIHRGDLEMAQVMAAASLPEPPTGPRQLREDGEQFMLSGGVELPFTRRPGLDLPEIPRDYLSVDAQGKFLEMERIAHGLSPQV